MKSVLFLSVLAAAVSSNTAASDCSSGEEIGAHLEGRIEFSEIRSSYYEYCTGGHYGGGYQTTSVYFRRPGPCDDPFGNKTDADCHHRDRRSSSYFGFLTTLQWYYIPRVCTKIAVTHIKDITMVCDEPKDGCEYILKFRIDNGNLNTVSVAKGADGALRYTVPNMPVAMYNGDGTLNTGEVNVTEFWFEAVSCESVGSTNYLEDTSTTAGVRRVGEGEVLRMVDKGANRTARVVMCAAPQWAYAGSGWITNGAEANYSGRSHSSVTGLLDQYFHSFSVEVYPESQENIIFNADVGKIGEIKGLINNVLGVISGDYNKVYFGGELRIDRKWVDLYNDGTDLGKYYSVVGGVDATIHEIKFSTPEIPMATIGYVKGEGVIKPTSFKLGGSYVYDPSAPNNKDSNRIVVEGTASVGAGVEFGVGNPNLLAGGVVVLIDATVGVGGSFGCRSGSDNLDFEIKIKAGEVMARAEAVVRSARTWDIRVEVGEKQLAGPQEYIRKFELEN